MKKMLIGMSMLLGTVFTANAGTENMLEVDRAIYGVSNLLVAEEVCERQLTRSEFALAILNLLEVAPDSPFKEILFVVHLTTIRTIESLDTPGNPTTVEFCNHMRSIVVE